MAVPEDNKTDIQNKTAEPEKKSSFGKNFLNFLMAGGFLLVIIIIVILVVVISIAVKSC
jgi:hypothetical protein